MMEWHLSTLVGLASAQVFLYQISSRQALKAFALLGFFYLFLFSFVEGLRIFCTLHSRFFYEFFELLLLALTLFVIFGRGVRGFPNFKKAFREVPDFYFLSSFWISLAWLVFLGRRDSQAITSNLLDGFLWSFFAASALPILSAIKERLAILDPPDSFRGLPIFLITTGIFLLGLSAFLR